MTRTSVDDDRCRDEDPDGILRWIVRSYPAGRVLWAGEPAGSAGAVLAMLRAEGVDAWALADTAGDGPAPPVGPGELSLRGVAGDQPEGRFDLAVLGGTFGTLPLAARRDVLSTVCGHAGAVLVSPVRPEAGDELATLFAEHGFFADLPGGSGDLPGGAVLHRDLRLPPEHRPRGGALVGSWAELVGQRDDAIAEHDRLAERFNALAREHSSAQKHQSAEIARQAEELERQQAEIARQAEELERQQAEIARQAEELKDLRLRRQAESLAASDAARQVEMEFAAVARELAVQRAAVQAAQAELEALSSTKLMRYSHRLRRVYGRLRHLHQGLLDDPTGAAPVPSDGDQSYDVWVEAFDTMDDDRRRKIAAQLAELDTPPLISILFPVYNTPEPLLRRAIESVRDQIYGNWELCIADDKSTDPTVAAVLDEYAAADERIRVVHRTENGHISASSNSALELASGSWIAPMDHDDELAPHALAHAVLALAGRPEVGMLYTDEDKIDVDGHRQAPYFKPDFDPLLLLGQNYLGHLIFYRHDLVKEVGGYRVGFEGSQDWDLSLRVSELLSAEQVVHLPRILYHWRAHPGSTAGAMSAKPYATLAGRRAVVDHLARQRQSGDVITNPATGWHRIKWHLPSQAPKVSIIVPTRDGRLLSRCLDSVFRLTAYPNYEIVVIDNGSLGRGTLDYLRAQEHLVRVIRDERPFNYSALNNFAASRSDGDVVCLLNDDCEVTSTEWLNELVGQLSQDGVGAVGAKLLYPDGRIQHAGVVLGLDGVAGHVHRLSDRMASGHGGRLHLAQSFSAVTAACMVVRREAWEQVGGLDAENLPVAFNDVDLCLRIREAGWRIVWSPFAEMIHHESVTRGEDTGDKAERFARECAYMKTRWAKELRCDPAYNPNLSLQSEGWELAFPPRQDCMS